MTAFPELEVFTKRETVKVTARLVHVCCRLSAATEVTPLVGETVAQFAARVMQENCGSIAQAKNAVIEIRVVAEEEGA